MHDTPKPMHKTTIWRRLLCRILGHRWFVHMDLTKPPARCARCGAYARFKTDV